MALSRVEVEWLMRPEPFPSLADLLPPRPAWMAAGACRDRPEVTWFPNKGESAAQAKVVCLTECPQQIRTACLEFALETDAEGVWGGTSARERRALS